MAPSARSPANPPLPPNWLANSKLPIKEVPPGAELFRIHRRDQHAVFFGPGRGKPPTHRFDAPGGEFGVLYAGLDFTGALVETLLRKPEIRIVDLIDLEIRDLTILKALRPLRLVGAYGAGLSSIGCTAALSTARYALAGAWSLALWSHREQADGLIYHSRHNPEHLCTAIFKRPGVTLRVFKTSPLLADTAKLARILEEHGKSLALP